MIERRSLECNVFENEETARKYARESGRWMRNIAKSFISLAARWKITTGRVLDVGTGAGALAIEFAKKIPTIEVMGLDLSSDILTVAQENAEKHNLASRVFFKRGDAEDMPFESNTFDVVISSNTIHLLNHPINMFCEVQRVLISRGRFIMSDFRRSFVGIFTPHIRASYSLKEMRDLLNQSELQNWEIKDSFFWLTILSRDNGQL